MRDPQIQCLGRRICRYIGCILKSQIIHQIFGQMPQERRMTLCNLLQHRVPFLECIIQRVPKAK